MKKFLILAIIQFIIIGCSHNPKNRIEKAFEKYVSETYVDKSNFKEIKSIEQLDSIDFLGMAYETLELSEDAVSKMDSVTEVFNLTLSSAPKSNRL